MRKGIKQYLKSLKNKDLNINLNQALDGLQVLYRYSKPDCCVIGIIIGSNVMASSIHVLFDNNEDEVVHIDSLEILIND